MTTMRALRLNGRGADLCDVAVPPLTRRDDVRVRVTVVGLCRTDLLVAEGKLPAANPVILGHEFSGVVEATGPAVRGVTVGDRVAVNPVFGCGACVVCLGADEINCPHRTMLGMDRDGAFAEFVVVPAANVFPVPAAVSDQAAAYAEPVAAALAVLNAGLSPHQKGLIFGVNRFARLLEQVLRDAGFRDVTTGNSVGDDAYDFVAETQLGSDTLTHMMRATKPGGTLILKSRVPTSVPIDFGPTVRKQLTLRGVNYGSFRRAVGLLVEGRLKLSDVFGPVFALADWRAAFAAARGEAAKVFIRPA